MPKTKLAKRVEWIKRIKSYRNSDKRCSYPWTINNLGYCWGYACWVDFHNSGDENLDPRYKVKNYIEFCKDCECWKGE